MTHPHVLQSAQKVHIGSADWEGIAKLVHEKLVSCVGNISTPLAAGSELPLVAYMATGAPSASMSLHKTKIMFPRKGSMSAPMGKKMKASTTHIWKLNNKLLRREAARKALKEELALVKARSSVMVAGRIRKQAAKYMGVSLLRVVI